MSGKGETQYILHSYSSSDFSIPPPGVSPSLRCTHASLSQCPSFYPFSRGMIYSVTFFPRPRPRPRHPPPPPSYCHSSSSSSSKRSPRPTPSPPPSSISPRCRRRFPGFPRHSEGNGIDDTHPVNAPPRPSEVIGDKTLRGTYGNFASGRTNM